MVATVTPDDISRNPAWHLYDLDMGRGELHFLEATPETFAISPFLDSRIAYVKTELHSFSVDTVIEALQHSPPRPVNMNFLLHSSFCCSSLLARSLAHEGRVLALREPWILRRLADMRRELEARGETWGTRGAALVDMALTLLGKTWKDSESVLIKPTNVANNLARDMLAARPHARALLLYSDLESFLVSNLKKTDETKQKIPVLARLFGREAGYPELFPDVELAKLGYLQAVVVTWHAQMLAFRKLLESGDAARLASLDSAMLLARPEESLAAVTGFFQYLLDEGEMARIIDGPIWKTHSKDPFSAYDQATRERENREVSEHHAADIRAALHWAEPLLIRQPVGPVLPRTLVSYP